MGQSQSEKEAFVASANMLTAFLRGAIAARADGNRQHMKQNVQAVRDVLADDLAHGAPDRGAKTEVLLVVTSELVRLLCEQIAGTDPMHQLQAFEDAVSVFGRSAERRMNTDTDEGQSSE